MRCSARNNTREQSRRQLSAAIAVAVPVVLLAVLLLLQGSYMKHHDAIDRYLNNSEPLCRIPDIDSGFIPQGLSFDSATGRLLLTGYMGSGGSSPIYVIDAGSGEAKKILMRTADGGRFRGHAGGMSLLDGTVYVAGSTGGCMLAFPLDSLYAAEDGSELRAAVRTDLKSDSDRIRVSFTATDGALLYAGEFCSGPLFHTHPSHAVSTPEGRQKAWLVGFSPDAEGGAVPAIVYSIPDRVQGACFDGSRLYLSRTDSLFSAQVLRYDLDGLVPSGTATVLGRDVPLYILTVGTANKITRIPPMSEELLVVDGRMVILFESASNRYRIGKRLGLDRVLATPLSFFD